MCNGTDDDCDGLVDEGFDQDNDGYTTCEGDCDDGNALRYPGAFELCNGVDEDCDGLVDEGFDLDGDGYTVCQSDCNDSNAAVHPGATEVCNNTDDDCDGLTDEGFFLLEFLVEFRHGEFRQHRRRCGRTKLILSCCGK